MIEERKNRKTPEREGEAVFIEKTKSISLKSQVVLDGYVRPNEKIGRQQAIRTGEQLYWPDKPCKREHEYWRIVKNGKCLACVHIHTVNKRCMPATRGTSWRAAEDRRERLEKLSAGR